MTDYGIVRSSVKPEPIKINEYSVYINTDIESINETYEDGTSFNGYSSHMIRYDKDEYIRMIIKENSNLSKQVIETQLGLCEVYEKMEAQNG